MIIRHAQSQDKKRVLEMAQNFYSVSGYENDIPFDYDSCCDLFDMSLSHGLICVAESDELVGFVLGIAMPSMMNKNYLVGCELAWWVEPHCRGKVGIQLLRHIEKSAKELGLKMWSMMSLESQNPEIIDRIYINSGYEKTENTFTKRLH